MYGAGLRLMECCRLRVKDVDRARGQLTVRGGKGRQGSIRGAASSDTQADPERPHHPSVRISWVTRSCHSSAGAG